MAVSPNENNPIPFNPEGMTARQLFDAADALSHIYNSLDRIDALEDGEEKEALTANLLFHIKQGRDSFKRRWTR